jgi:farnesyl-diphosphate farnesyltransferase
MNDPQRVLTEVLKGVSRAFYLSMRILPAGAREPVALGYLLARAADTIADTRVIAPEQRLTHLLSFRKQVQGPADIKALNEIASALTEKQGNEKERKLLQALPAIFELLEKLSEADRASVRKIVTTLTEGMEFDLKTFPSEDSGQLRALNTQAELDRYTYYVAGCVGAFWTEVTHRHVSALEHWDVAKMSEIGIRFGKALQYTNILRDVPGDLRIGRCYLPLEVLEPIAVKPQDLLDAKNSAKALPALKRELHIALEHFEQAEAYVLATPRLCLRLRLSVLWPVLIGLATLAQLPSHPAWLQHGKPIKVTRGWIYRMMLGSLFAVWSNTLTKAWIGSWKEALRRQLT